MLELSGELVDNNSVSEVFQINAQGINPKVQKQKIKLKALSEYVATSKKKIPFFCVIETHLKEYIFDAEVSIPDYNIMRADRAKRKNGGVAIYAHHSFSMDDTQVFTNSYCECVMTHNKHNKLTIIAVYRPPETQHHLFSECIEKITDYIKKYEDYTTLIFGDMNLKFIDLKTETVRKPATIAQEISTEERNSSNLLLDFISDGV